MIRIKVVFLLIGIIIILALTLGTGENFSWESRRSSYLKTEQLGLPEMQYPADNYPTKDKIALGRKLFMDRRLSHNNTISCAMCHVPEQGFTTNELATAVGIEGRSNRRNSPTIFNVGYLKLLFHDGREYSLENQVIGPMVTFNEMGNPSIGHVIEKIRNFKDYDGMFEKVFGAGINLERMSKAIAAYERTLVSGNSKFDQWYYSKNQKALENKEINGFNIFIGKGKCVACHSINEKVAIFTDQSFHNTGIGWARNNKVVNKIYESKTFPVTLAPGIVVQVEQGRLDAASEVPQNDVGRFEITENPKDSWAYKTPSLRNVAITAPYMHDGSITTLDDVVEFYNKGGEDNPLKDTLIQPLGLSDEEKSDLVSFLKTLTGANVIQLEKEAREAYSEPAVP
jgi:cytochrome c peroxidase